MQRLRDVTFGQAFEGLRPYLPFAGLSAVVALLLVALPAPGGDDAVDAAGGSAPSALDAPSPTTSAGELATSAGAPALRDTGTGQQATAQPTGGPGQAGEPVPSGSAVARPSSTWPGVGSKAALAAPDCDPATGYLRMPSKIFNLPCVPLWPAGSDNGGATAAGVTAESVKVVVYYPEADAAAQAALTAAGVSDTEAQLEATLAGVAQLYGRHAELYGRKIELIKVKGSGTTLENERADAVQAVNKHHPFAAIYQSGNCVPGGFGYQMALRKVVAICSSTDQLDYLRNAEPYLWVTPYAAVMLHEQHLLFTAEMMCKRLAGHPARWAGDPLLKAKARTFGWLYIDSPEFGPGKALFLQRLAGCGIRPVSVGLSADLAEQQGQMPTAIAKLKAAGVNVVVLDAGFLGGGVATKQATNQSYRPEWFATGFAYTDATIFVRAAYDPTQATSLYAFREVPLQPAKEKGDGWSFYRWENGENPPAKLLGQDSILPVWQTLAAGIQLAGPTLTPISFRDGLLRQPPFGGSYSGSVSSAGKSFGARGIWPWETTKYFDNTAVDDTTFTWWSGTASGQDESGKPGVGMMMFVDGGRRFRLGALPTGEPDFFNPSNGTAEIADLGPADKPPSYPNKKGCPTRQACWSG